MKAKIFSHQQITVLFYRAGIVGNSERDIPPGPVFIRFNDVSYFFLNPSSNTGINYLM